ncbi:hypothetical protein Fmac_023098 [Flemingia macrophylla]|uniref:Uncharacterized protein n=1 Tax=Flemingia macrophylla TaxID=520843 RepID=A0ABD1LKL0_9FABA
MATIIVISDLRLGTKLNYYADVTLVNGFELALLSSLPEFWISTLLDICRSNPINNQILAD